MPALTTWPSVISQWLLQARKQSKYLFRTVSVYVLSLIRGLRIYLDWNSAVVVCPCKYHRMISVLYSMYCICFTCTVCIPSGNAEDEQRLPKEKLFALGQYPPVHKFVRKSDYAFFQALVEVLIPDVLRPIPSKLFSVFVVHICCSNLSLYVPWPVVLVLVTPCKLEKSMAISCTHTNLQVCLSGGGF